MKRSDVFRERVEKEPSNMLFRYSFAQALFDEENISEAIPHLEYCTSLNNNWMMAYILLGKSYLHIDKKIEAKKMLEHALQLAIEQNHQSPQAELYQILEDL